ncbi:uncharacterized protein LOC115696284 [Cannabis sativa]|uniref:uncharacterized protein LOC115696284 n=1 Tax=Cannabis sativa TaxID=3483 RepID=UPI0011E00590|nr:uncharacterized protein LOC115696284 [Cannabis sativa]
MGDFHDYLSLSDKIGGDMSRAPSTQFQSFVDNHARHPISPLGNLFTWTNRQKQPSHTQERLDWCLSNANWDVHFPTPRLYHGDFFGSDHQPLIITLHHSVDQSHHVPRFIFDRLWMSEPDFETCLRDAWMLNNQNHHSNPLIGFNEKLSNCSSRLKQWKQSLGPPLATQIREVQSQLKVVQSFPRPTNDKLDQGRKLEKELNSLLQKEEDYWQQRSRVTWL